MSVTKVSLLLLLSLAGMSVHAQDTEADARTPASVINVDVKFPGAGNREALVVLDFTINPDGTASDISLVDIGFHEKRFVDAATKALRNGRFTPRTVNGVPEASRNRIPFRFAVIGQEKGVTPDFMREVVKVSKLINDKDFAGAHFHAKWMLSEKVNLLFEYAALQATLANTYARVGEKHAALTAARAATVRTTSEVAEFTPGAPIAANSPENYLLNKELVEQLLQLRMVLADSLGFSVDALDAYSQLAGLREMRIDDPLAEAATQLTKAILGNRPLVANAKLDEQGEWAHQSYRPSVAVRNVSAGAMKEARILCKGSIRTLEYIKGEVWPLPMPPTGCSLLFVGDPGTTFQIVELAQPASASGIPSAKPTSAP